MSTPYSVVRNRYSATRTPSCRSGTLRTSNLACGETNQLARAPIGW